jgi:hypothetical protein
MVHQDVTSRVAPLVMPPMWAAIGTGRPPHICEAVGDAHSASVVDSEGN